MLFRSPKKPGHTTGDYRVIVKLASARTAQLQIVTRAEPFRASTDTARSNIVEVTGTGAFQTVEINGVPLHPGELETCSVFARSSDASAAHTAGTYGTPVTGLGVGEFADTALFLGGADPSSWGITSEDAPNDYGSRGFFVEIEEVSTSTRIAFVRMTDVSAGPNALGLFCYVQIEGGVPATLRQWLRARGEAARWRLYEPSRISFASVSGAVAARSA